MNNFFGTYSAIAESKCMNKPDDEKEKNTFQIFNVKQAEAASSVRTHNAKASWSVLSWSERHHRCLASKPTDRAPADQLKTVTRSEPIQSNPMAGKTDIASVIFGW